MLHSLRWRRPPRERGRSWAGWALALLLHLAFFAGTWWEMQPRAGEPFPHRERVDALQVRWIPRAAPTPAAAPPPAPEPPPLLPPKPRPAREAPSPNAIAVTLPAGAATVAAPPALRLYDADGRPLLPSASSSAPSAPGYVQNAPQGDAAVMQHKTTVTYKATRFADTWDKGDNAFDSALRRAVEKTTVTHTFHLAPGVRIKCGVSLAALAGGCGAGDPPAGPSAKVGDERLNMAPTAPLVPPSTPPPPPPSDADCIAIYRAGKPLPHGCPVDTPNRSVDAELKEKAAIRP